MSKMTDNEQPIETVTQIEIHALTALHHVLETKSWHKNKKKIYEVSEKLCGIKPRDHRSPDGLYGQVVLIWLCWLEDLGVLCC